MSATEASVAVEERLPEKVILEVGLGGLVLLASTLTLTGWPASLRIASRWPLTASAM
jgi:hypothetical protein